MNEQELTEHITTSEILQDARIYGYYVREQIEAHGSFMPEWMVEQLVDEAAYRTDQAVDFLMFDCELGFFLKREHIEIAVEAITIRDMPLDCFAEFMFVLQKESIDPPENRE